MGAGLLQVRGQVAGIGGIALGVVFLIFRQVLRKRLTQHQVTLVIVLTFVIGLAGTGAWVFSEAKPASTRIETQGNNSPVVSDTDGNVEINIGTEGTGPRELD